MKCLVCIPSKKRSNNISKYIIPFMERLKLDYRIFVEPQDIEDYKDYDNIVILPENDKGLGYSTLYAKNYAIENGYELYFKVDDDVSGIGEIENDMDKVLKSFSMPKVGAVVFPYEFEFYAKTEKLFTRVNKRMQTCYIIRTNLYMPSVEVSTFEDFYQFLLIRQKGFITLYCSRHMIKCAKVGGGKGGLQTFDRSEMAKKEIQIFKSIDPTIEIIQKPEKPWKWEPKFKGEKYKSKPI